MASKLSKINDKLHVRSREAELTEDILAIESISEAVARPPVPPVPPAAWYVGRFRLAWDVDADGRPVCLTVWCRNPAALDHLAAFLEQYGRHVFRPAAANEIWVAV